MAPVSAAPTAYAPFASAPQPATPTPAPTTAAAAPGSDTPIENKGPDVTDALELIVDTIDAVGEERGENEPVWGSMIKQAIKRRNPGFNERAYGFRSFNDLLAEGQKRGLLVLKADEKSGGYTVRLTGPEPLV
jgi:hypothetical protein